MELTRLICVFALASAVGACGSDLTSTGDGTGNLGGGIGSDGGPTNACLNEADQAVFESLTYVDDDGEDNAGTDAASAIGGDCALGTGEGDCGVLASLVLGANTPENRANLTACVTACTNQIISVNTEPSATLSEDCLGCYGDAVTCGAAFCAGDCIASTTAPVCIQCRDDNGCNGNFDTCSGIID